MEEERIKTNMNFINKIQKFMIRRYGLDDLSNSFFILYFLILIINLFFKSVWLSLIELILIFIILFRSLSKNIYQRSKENKQFLKFKKKILKPFINLKRNIKDKDHIYRKCHKCHTTLKLPIPYERGIKHTKCPKCQNRLTFLVLRKEKVEIIRN